VDCIIQDDIDDWQKEVASMADVYGNACITLAATSAGNATEGCFSERLPRYQAHEVLVKGPDGKEYQVFVRLTLPHLYGGSGTFPLLQRAWVFQERPLSPRVLHFGKTELIWECAEIPTCECAFTHIENGGRTGHLKLDHHRFTVDDSNKDDLCDDWHWMVTNYSRLNLTHERDRLPAFAGLAKQMQEKMQGGYLAGLWENFLYRDLLWITDGYDSRQKRPAICCAPTWSWASVKGCVYYEGSNIETVPHRDFSLKKVDCVPAGPDIYGGLKSCHLTVSGRVISAPLAYHSADDPSSETSHESFIQVEPNTEEASFVLDYSAHLKEVGYIAPGETVYGLLIAEKDGAGHFLILKCQDEHTQTYERIGISSFWDLSRFRNADVPKTLTIV
jgi:hypothetical protein